ncbi:MAG TPA: cyclic nucleotide-binding domain-containing protein [Herpetosiphonaceae bacterium]
MPADLSAQIAVLSAIPALASLPHAELRLIAEAAVFRVFAPGATLVSAGSSGNFCYLVLTGALSSLTMDKDQREIVLDVLGPGDTFGGGLLFGSRQRLTTIRTDEQTWLLQLGIDTLRDKLTLMPGFAEILERHFRQRRVMSTLSRVPLFSQLCLDDRQTLIDHLSRRTFDRATTIFEQGTPGKALFLIEQGQITVEQDNKVIATLAEGDFFGEMALLSGATHNATVRTLTPVRCLELPGEVFRWLIEEHPTLAQALRAVIDTRLNNAAMMRADAEQRERLSVGVASGMLRGTHILARTPDLCPPGCRICEEACASRFGASRLRLDGVQLGELDVTVSCRQCRVGAECVEACPENAIQWDEYGALRITPACTGCGDCAPACPYDAVGMIPLQAAPPRNLLLELVRRLRKEPEAPAQLIANKCDLCSGHSDRACLSQCPTGALRLIPIEEVFPL